MLSQLPYPFCPYIFHIKRNRHDSWGQDQHYCPRAHAIEYCKHDQTWNRVDCDPAECQKCRDGCCRSKNVQRTYLSAIKLGTTRPYPDAAVAATTTRCALNFPVVAVSTILEELRFLVEVLWPAVDEIAA